MTLRRCCQRFLNGPAFLQALCYQPSIKTESTGPLGSAEALAVELYIKVFGGVLKLFTSCGPFAIVWRVASVIIDAFDCQPRRALTHVSMKVIEDHPRLANGDPSGSVSPEVFVPCVVASRQHLFPDAVLSGSWAVRRSAAVRLRPTENSQATAATLGVAFQQATSRNDCVTPAGASALPQWSTRRVLAGQGDNSQSTKDHTGQIFRMSGSGYSLFSHAVSPLGAVLVRRWWSLTTAACAAQFYPRNTVVLSCEVAA